MGLPATNRVAGHIAVRASRLGGASPEEEVGAVVAAACRRTVAPTDGMANHRCCPDDDVRSMEEGGADGRDSAPELGGRATVPASADKSSDNCSCCCCCVPIGVDEGVGALCIPLVDRTRIRATIAVPEGEADAMTLTAVVLPRRRDRGYQWSATTGVVVAVAPLLPPRLRPTLRQ